MTTKKAYPYTYTQTHGTKECEFGHLERIKNINSSYAQSVGELKGKKATPNKPSKIVLSNWKAGIPTGAMIQKITVYYCHQKIPKKENQYPNIGAPTIDVLHKGKSIWKKGKKSPKVMKGKAPTKNKKTEKVTFNVNASVAQINSTDFQVSIDYPTNANTIDGYMRIYYVYVVVTYKPSNFSVSIKKSKGGYNKEEYRITAKVANKNPTGYNPKLIITSPTGFTYRASRSKGNGTIKKIDANTFEWTPRMTKRTKSNSYDLSFDVNVIYPAGKTSHDYVFRISERLNGHNASHTAHIKDRPKSQTDTRKDEYHDDETDTSGTVDTDKDQQTIPEADYTVPVSINNEYIYLKWLPPGWILEILNEIGITAEDIATMSVHTYIESDQYISWKIGTLGDNDHVDPYHIWSQGGGTGGMWVQAWDVQMDSICDIEIKSEHQCRANILFKVRLTIDTTLGEHYVHEGFAGGGIFDFVVTEEQKTALGMPFCTILELTDEEKDRLGDGHNYIIQSYMQVRVEIPDGALIPDLKDWGGNYRIIVFNNQIGTPIRIKENDDDNAELIEYDPTDYGSLTIEEMYHNALYKGTAPTTLNEFQNTECEFTYNEKYPLVIFICGDYKNVNDPAKIDFTEPAIIEADRYDAYEEKGNYPILIDDLIANDGSSAEITIPIHENSSDLIVSKWPLDEGYGTDEDLAIRGIGVEANIEKSDTMILYAKLKSPKGETGSRSIILSDNDTDVDSTNNIEIGGLGDFWNFNTEDLVDMEDWEIEFTINNTLIDTEGYLNFGDIKLILYTETIEAQDVQTIIDGDDIASYGVYLSDQKIPQGLNTETDYLNANGTDYNEASVQAIREKTIELEFAVNSCDITTSTDMLRQVVQLLITQRDEYNKPIPKRIEFSNYPDLFWEYILEDTMDAEIEISDYTVKAKLIVPAGTAFKKESTVTNNIGHVQGLTAVKPVIVIKPNDEDNIEVKETISDQTFNMGFTGDWENHLVEIDCSNRVVLLKEAEDDTDPLNITRYVDISSDWFRLLGEYSFETSNCTLYSVEYIERW